MTRQDKLDEIALQIQRWLDDQEQDYRDLNIELTPESLIISVAVFPSRGTLQEWVKVLNEPPGSEVKSCYKCDFVSTCGYFKQIREMNLRELGSEAELMQSDIVRAIAKRCECYEEGENNP